MTPLYPLRFQPTFRQYIWGGRRLEDVLGKSIGPGETFAESWEVVDHGADQSIVSDGPLSGKSLHELVETYGTALLGNAAGVQFPLLFKFLDANRDLSVQVHPNDQQAALLDPPDLGKTEAWVVVDALPGSFIYAGLLNGIDRDALAEAVAVGRTETVLHRMEAKPGDCIFIPAGTVHAIGAGLLVAEIQQASDTTYRLFDWNRVDTDGKPRELHIEQALDVIDYQSGPVTCSPPEPTDDPRIVSLVKCDKFSLRRWTFGEAKTIAADGRCRIVAVLTGSIVVEGDDAGELTKGQTVLLSAALGPIKITPSSETTLLEMILPGA